jgi:hypothetical protein
MLVLGVANSGPGRDPGAGRADRGRRGVPAREVSRWGAAALIGPPVGLVHWWWAQRLGRSSVDERASALRRLYLYASLSVGPDRHRRGLHGLLSEAIDGDVADAIAETPRTSSPGS